ncbi:unnamed protein product, partial [Protopolystoma xenopodis]
LFLAYNYDFDRPAKRVPICQAFSSSTRSCSPIQTLGRLEAPEPHNHVSTGNVDPDPVQALSVPDCGPACTGTGGHQHLGYEEKSPFQLALERGHLEMARVLSEVGCCRMRVPTSAGLGPSSLPPAGFSAMLCLAQHTSPSARRYAGLDEVKPLRHWCRKVIRQGLGFRFLDALPQLPLPAPLKDFLLLSDIDWLLNNPATGVGPAGQMATIVPRPLRQPRDRGGLQPGRPEMLSSSISAFRLSCGQGFLAGRNGSAALRRSFTDANIQNLHTQLPSL